jgi:hypothetical protein
MKCPASKPLSKNMPESKSKPAKKAARISSADALAKDAGTELSENELKRVAGGIKLDYKE